MSNNKPTNKQLIAPTLMAMFKQAAHCVMAPALFNHGCSDRQLICVVALLFMVIMFNQAADCVMAKFKHLCSSLSH